MPLKPIVLKGEQKRVLFLPPTEPIQIKGVAGSGKTTVALYRAKHLLETHSNLFQEAKVVIFTYNTTLTAYINAIKSSISGGYQKDGDEMLPGIPVGLNVSVTNFDKYAYHFLRGCGLKPYIDRNTIKIWKNSTILEAKNYFLKQFPTSKILKRNIEFFLEEFSWIKGKLFENKGDYLSGNRTGRGTSGLNSVARERIWMVYEYYKEKARTDNKIDFDDYPILMLQSIKRDEAYKPPFTHIIIDEAQDLSKAQVLALSSLVSNETRSITIIADAAQKIYKKGFTWTEVGIEVRGGRTLPLKKNYRNTEAILKASISLLEHEPDKSEFTEAEAGRKGGEKPIIGYFKNWNEQFVYILNKLKEIDFENTVTVILHREWRGMRMISAGLSEHKIENELINGNPILNFDNNLIKICTLSSVKGLEFDNVFIIDLNEGIMPYPNDFDIEEDEFHISTERRLLYTSMTRARDKLYLLSSGNPSRYLSEIEKELVVAVS